MSSKNTNLSSHCQIANTLIARIVGLLRRPSLAEDASLLITPCSSIHTWFMRFPIDAVFLNEALEVLKIDEAVPPFRIRLGARGARSVLELPAGRARRVGLTIGDHLTLSQAS